MAATLADQFLHWKSVARERRATGIVRFGKETDMEEPRNPETLADSDRADAARANASARPGAEARGGIDPHPGDPTSPAAAAERAKARKRALEEGGFGDDKGERI